MSATNKGTRRKTLGSDNEVKIGTRIKALFKDEVWYGGIVKTIKKSK